MKFKTKEIVIKKLALIFVVLLSAAQSFAQTIDSAVYTTDASHFYFDLTVSNVPVAESMSIRMSDPNGAFGGIDTEVVTVNFDTSSGVITAGPFVSSYGSPVNNRWPTGAIADLNIDANGAGSWRIHGSIPHGADPFVIGDTLAETAIRRLVAPIQPDVFAFNTPVTSAAAPPVSPGPLPLSSSATSVPTLPWFALALLVLALPMVARRGRATERK